MTNGQNVKRLFTSVCFVIAGPCRFLPYGDPIYPDAERQEPSEHEYLIEPTECVGYCGLGAIFLAQAQEERGWSQLHPIENAQEPYSRYYEQVASADRAIPDKHPHQNVNPQLPC